MSKFTSEKISRFYKKVGLSNAEFFDGKNPVNLFKILKIDPQVDECGKQEENKKATYGSDNSSEPFFPFHFITAL